MRNLIQGGESVARFKLLLQLTKISSEGVQDALQDYLCKGYSDTASAALNGVQLSNFNRALHKLNDVAAIIEQIKDLDWQHLKSVK
ncbi:PapB/FocB family fimbrial expression transcriptional regulator [Rheinheimera salexigens]|uniref:Adhesin biosynthesis transcription regulatory protein n=1 Tax=Rheinheimera salexigens TaxID=1628148 RepID=A0A1E7Q8E8_9GAMM|nr:PapB/FocB family fimbrial expression transcriptional regulator [Rheinheimera salexigens]OEY70371.1 hypothetical protein BI198_12890 [Rheinheimera salexigens]